MTAITAATIDTMRGHRDVADRAVYEGFVREVVMRRNRRNAAAFNVEREHLQDLPLRRTTDFVEEEARVTRCGTFTVRGILYSAPSRLIGHRLKVRIYPDRLDCYLGGALAHSTPRGSPAGDNRRALGYRHFVDALKRKPQAFKGLTFRDDLFPREAYRQTWERLDARMTPRDACKTMVGLLELAANHGVEAVLADRLDALLTAGELPNLHRLPVTATRAMHLTYEKYIYRIRASHPRYVPSQISLSQVLAEHRSAAASSLILPFPRAPPASK